MWAHLLRKNRPLIQGGAKEAQCVKVFTTSQAAGAGGRLQLLVLILAKIQKQYKSTSRGEWVNGGISNQWNTINKKKSLTDAIM